MTLINLMRRIIPALLTICLLTLSNALLATSMNELSGEYGCPIPGQVVVNAVTDTSAVISWLQSDSTTAVDIRLINTSSFVPDTVFYFDVVSPHMITMTEACQFYEVSVMATCADSVSGFSDPVEFITDGCCKVPSGFIADEITATTTLLNWDDVVVADSFIVRYKPTTLSDDEEWIKVGVDTNFYLLEELEECTAYDVQVQSSCGGDTTGYSDALFLQTIGCGSCTETEYCETGGVDATKNWIDSISLANIMMWTGSNGGYFAYTTEQAVLERGRTYDFFIEPGFRDDPCPQYLRMWMDYDLDGVFNDSTELLVDTIDTEGLGIHGNFMIADTVPRDVTRLRISMKSMAPTDTTAQTSCGIFDFGEVEDYCIRIDEPCPPVENLDTVEIQLEEATIRWSSDESAFGYIYNYQELGESPGEPMITGDTFVNLFDLTECTEYEFTVVSVCEQDTNSASIIFKTRCQTAVEDLTPLVKDVKLYPNPFSNTFHLELESLEALQGVIQLSSITGQLMYNEKIDLFAGEHLIRDFDELSEAAPGIYILMIRTNDKLLAKKLIKSGN